ncbi:MAG: helix-turn-helix domain-containing protein [Myxococcales bacterium]|nr:helix-turn-helix domain-containing protein [Myxococcales bacterium]
MPTQTPHRAHDVCDPEQRKALASPIRLEILGLLDTPQPQSVRDLAHQMGRPTTAVYYHVHRLVEVGLVRRVGSRPRRKKPEALFGLVADTLTLPVDTPDQHEDAARTLRAAQRMAARDMAASLTHGTARFEGDHRNFLAVRLHAACSPDALRRINAHLDAVIALLGEQGPPTEDAEFCSLTLAWMPLPDRRRPQ